MLTLLLVLLVVFVVAGATGYGGLYPATWGPGYGWLPGLLVLVLLVLALTGRI